MLGTEIIIIDPENEYEKLADSVDGAYIRLSLNSSTRINPFDLPKAIVMDEEDDALRSKFNNSSWAIPVNDGRSPSSINWRQHHTNAGLSPVEEADLDTALIETYAKAGITSDPLTHTASRQLSVICTKPYSIWGDWTTACPKIT